MPKEPGPKDGDPGPLWPVNADEQHEILNRWRAAGNGMDGPRGGVPSKPDDPVAYTLLEAADQVMSLGDLQRGVNILRLVVRDYRESQEAALARTVLDRLARRG